MRHNDFFPIDLTKDTISDVITKYANLELPGAREAVLHSAYHRQFLNHVIQSDLQMKALEYQYKLILNTP
jgi:hypothetical protein